jgi:carbonic anhydrase/acetyltransferase-like protein (isoleucine patch superfamily)
MPIYEFEGRRPSVGSTTFIHPDAVLIGDVRIAGTCFIGAGAVLRADWGTIFIGEGSNVQENAVLHAPLNSSMVLGPNSHVGHGAILHACTLDEHVMVGMGAILNDGTHAGDNSVIGAGSVVPPRMEIPPGKLVMGVPARVVKDVDERMAEFTWHGTRLYQTLPERYGKTLKPLDVEECRAEDE